MCSCVHMCMTVHMIYVYMYDKCSLEKTLKMKLTIARTSARTSCNKRTPFLSGSVVCCGQDSTSSFNLSSLYTYRKRNKNKVMNNLSYRTHSLLLIKQASGLIKKNGPTLRETWNNISKINFLIVSLKREKTTLTRQGYLSCHEQWPQYGWVCLSHLQYW